MELVVQNNITNIDLVVSPGNNLELLLQSQQTIVLELDTCTGNGGGGGTAEATVITAIAAETINGDSVVMLKDGLAYKNDSSVIGNIYYCVGFAINSALAGQAVNITINGLQESAGWGLTQNQIYWAATNGGITTTPPAANISQIVGVGKDINTMLVNIAEPILLS